MVIAALLGLLPAILAPDFAEAQNPRRVLGPFAGPFRMIFRALPHRHHRLRHHHSRHARQRPRVVRHRTAGAEHSRRQAAEQTARQRMIALWPVAAADAFEDMLGYALWPREYGRQFWSRGPRDILQAMTAPTAAFASSPTGPRLPAAQSASAADNERAICIARVKDNAMQPIERIPDTIRLSAEQQDKLAKLRDAVRAAVDGEPAACRSDIPATQPARLQAMIDGLWAMRYATLHIRPALSAFFNSLDETQKAQLGGETQTVGSTATVSAGEPAAVCSEAIPTGANPFEPVARALQPTDEQQKSLQMLYGASMEMAKFLTSTCPAQNPATPAARLDAASDRVLYLLHAAMNIEPMLNSFYVQLSDQQRERFNTIVR